ncbi:MAG: FAD-dependent oxidoreductase [Pseudomonadota bacterium]
MTRAAQDSVLVIGAGVVGLACSHYLADAGFEVTVIDSGEIAGGCSRGNCGHILPSHVLPLNSPGALRTAIASFFDRSSPFRVRLRADLDLLRWLFQFVRHCGPRRVAHAAANLKALLDSSFDEFERLAPAFDCGWSPHGLLYLFAEPRNLDAFARMNERLAGEFGVAAEAVDAAHLEGVDRSLRPDLAGGFFYPRDASLDPQRLGRSWSAALEARGVRFIEYCAFEGLEMDRGRVVAVRTRRDIFRPGHVVLAAGAFSRALSRHFGRALPVEPGKGYAVTTDRPDPCPTTSILLPEKGVAITPFEDGLRIGSMMEFVGFDETIPEGRVAQLRAGAAAFLRSPPPPTRHRWFGWRPMTWDSLPIIGRLPGLENAFAATGHQMLGMMMAPGTGKLLAELVAGQPTHIPADAYAPARFH